MYFIGGHNLTFVESVTKVENISYILSINSLAISLLSNLSVLS